MMSGSESVSDSDVEPITDSIDDVIGETVRRTCHNITLEVVSPPVYSFDVYSAVNTVSREALQREVPDGIASE